MKILNLFIIITFVLVACSPKLNIPYERTGAVEFVSGDKNTMTVSSNAYAESESKAIYYAEMNALENILFRGIPKSNQENPMIANESTAMIKYKIVLDDLIKKEGYRKFMIASFRDETINSGKGIQVVQNVKFDLQALRKHLEDNGIVRKFGL